MAPLPFSSSSSLLLPDPSPYGTLTGQLFLYAGGRAAFESPPPPLPPLPPFASSAPASALDDALASYPPDPSEPTTALYCPNKCVLLGGLSDGLMPVPYTSELEGACRRACWSLVQPVLSSSYVGFGDGGTLDRDCAELDELLSYLVARRGASQFCLVGHSTGCQIAVRYLSVGDPCLVSRARLVVLQAPVSDREHYEASQNPEIRRSHLTVARELVREGKGDEMMPRDSFWAPVCARRFLDLHDRGGTDDYFSSDFTDEELRDRLSHVGRVLSCFTSPTSSSQSATLSSSSSLPPQRRKGGGPAVLVAFSGSDEYVPAHIDSRVLAGRLVEAMNSGGSRLSKGGGGVEKKENDDVRQADDEAGDIGDIYDAAEDAVAEVLYLPGANHNLSQGPGGELEAFVRRVEDLLRHAAHLSG